MALVCSCYAVRDRAVHDAALAADGDLGRVQELTGAGTGCGGCREEIERLVAAVGQRLERAGAA